jgi:hypothetical protein
MLGPIPPQEFRIRAGDDLPTLAAVLEDEYGEPFDLTDASCFMTIQSERDAAVILTTGIFIANPLSGVVSFDWDARLTVDYPPGIYQLYVTAIWPDGRQRTAPSDRSCTVEIRPGLVTLLTTGDDLDLTTGDGDQYVIDEFLTP